MRIVCNGTIATMDRMPGRIAPFILLSLLLHGTLLWLVQWPVERHQPAPPRPLTVTLSVAAVKPEVAPAPVPQPLPNAGKPVSRRTAPAAVSLLHPGAAPALQPQTEAALIPPEATVVAPVPQNFDAQTLREATRDIVRDEARRIEQQIAAQEKRRANSPFGMMEQQLRQTGKETRLANGMLKIETAAGTVCFQPVPYYARDQTGLYGIPVTCP